MGQDEVRHRTRISNSTLCTGSSLSLSSGPTSGYNSGNAAQLQLCSRSLLTGQVGALTLHRMEAVMFPFQGDCTVVRAQVAGFQDEGLKVRTRPPACGPHGVKTQRAWLSAHGNDSI